MEEMLAGKPPTTGERERREAQRRNAGNGGDVGDKTANHSEKNERKVWWYKEKLLSLHSENSPLQLKGYVDVAHSCRLYGAVSVFCPSLFSLLCTRKQVHPKEPIVFIPSGVRK